MTQQKLEFNIDPEQEATILREQRNSALDEVARWKTVVLQVLNDKAVLQAELDHTQKQVISLEEKLTEQIPTTRENHG